MLDFDDDEVAKEVVRQLLSEADTEFISQVGVTQLHAGEDFKVRGIWKKPTQFCDDQEPGHRSEYLKRIKSKMGGWTRGPRYGWWVDPACRRPTRNWAEGDRWWYSLGTNLLPKPYATEDKGQDVSDAIWNDVLPPTSKEG